MLPPRFACTLLSGWKSSRKNGDEAIWSTGENQRRRLRWSAVACIHLIPVFPCRAQHFDNGLLAGAVSDRLEAILWREDSTGAVAVT
jgi:hypothetical protein